MKSHFFALILIFSFTIHAALAVSEPFPVCLHKLTQNVVGKKLVQELSDPVEEVLESSLPPPYRIIRPGTMTTDDYIPKRLNLNVDDKDIIRYVYCG